MLKSLFDNRHQRLFKAIAQDDPDQVAALLPKLDPALLLTAGADGRHPLEAALTDARPRILELLLQRAPRPLAPARCGTPLSSLALQQPDSLPRLTLLLQAGEDPNLCHDGQPLLHLCVEHCAPTRLMLHLSRLLQHGADINARAADGRTLLQRLLPQGDLALLQFLLQSGADCNPQWLDQLTDAELARQLRRILEDLRIRRLLLGG